MTNLVQKAYRMGQTSARRNYPFNRAPFPFRSAQRKAWIAGYNSVKSAPDKPDPFRLYCAARNMPYEVFAPHRDKIMGCTEYLLFAIGIELEALRKEMKPTMGHALNLLSQLFQ